MEHVGKKKNPVGRILMWIILGIMAVIQIFPLIWLVDFSLASSNELFTKGLLIIPQKIQWGNYVKAFVDGHFLLYLKNSILINGLAVILVLLISIMAAFAVHRMQWKLSGFVKTLLLLGMMIPIHATLLPNYKLYNTLNITDTIWALLIPYVAFSLPQALYLMTGFLDSIPLELEEAAVMDGCGIYRILFQIITPLLKSSIATVSIMTFLDFTKEYVVISNKSTEKVVEASGVSEGSILIQSTYAGNAGQFFTIEDSYQSGYKLIRSMSSDLVVEVQNASQESGAQLIVSEYNGSDSQLWKIDDTVPQGYVKLENKASGKVFGVGGASKTEGLPLVQETKQSNDDEGEQSADGQRWDIIRTIDVKSAVMGENIDVSTASAWAKNALVAPVQNRLNGAGSVTTEFYPYTGANKYEIYFDGRLSITVAAALIEEAQKNQDYVSVTKTDGGKAKIYVTEEGTVKVFQSWYSTEISGHNIRIKTDNGADTGEVKFFLSKKGVGWSTLHRTENMNLGWYYRWSTDPALGTDERLEFVPMIWGNYGDEWLKDSSNKKYGTVLSFNEPDWSKQSNVPVTIESAQAWTERYNAANGTNIGRPASVEEAWKAFMDSGLRIGSPATALAPPYCNGTVTMNEVDGPDNWWFEFMDLMDTKEDWDYDFVAVHSYNGGCDVDSFLKMVDDTYELTQKPIWITEFGVASWDNHQWQGNNPMTQQQVIDFLTEVCRGLEERTFVERYAWFPFNPNDPYGGASGIFDYETGELTALGEVYATLGLPEGYEDIEEEEESSQEEPSEEQPSTEDPSKEVTAGGEGEQKKQNNQPEQLSQEIEKPAVKWNVNDKIVPLQLKNGKKANKTTVLQPTGLKKGDSIRSYNSSKPSVAAVKKASDGRLIITPKSIGKTKITVTTAFGAEASFTLKVQNAAVKVTKLTVDNVKKKKLTLNKGKSFTLKTTKKYITALDKVTFTSNNKKVAAVSSTGKITAKKKGTAKITVKCQKKKVVITVKVKE